MKSTIVKYIIFSGKLFYNYAAYFTRGLVDTDERVQQEALKALYQEREIEKSNFRNIQRMKRFNLVINPIICLSFVVVYWLVGLHHYMEKV